MGYSVDPSVNFHFSGQGMDAGIGLGATLDSQEGIGVNASVSIGSNFTGMGENFHGSAQYNSRGGLYGLSLGGSIANTVGYTHNFPGLFAKQAYVPSQSMAMEGRNAQFTIKTGVSLWGLFGDVQLGGFFNIQYPKYKTVSTKGYGYMNLQYPEYLPEEEKGKVLLDFNRDKDGMIRKNSHALPAPVMTHDVYSVTGQGIAGTYRPYRSDIGVLYDNETVGHVAGGAIGFDAGGNKLGVDLRINYSKTRSGKWKDDNNIASEYKFIGGSGNYEPYYFKNQGELTSDPLNDLDYLASESAVSIDLSTSGFKEFTADATLTDKDGKVKVNARNVKTPGRRESRNKNLIPVLKGSKTLAPEAYREFNVGTEGYHATTAPGHHVAGFTALNEDGTRYIYGLPAYNLEQKECQFSVQASSDLPNIEITKDGNKPNYKVSGTNQYFSRLNVPAYAHAYMLTSVLGADYVDADDIAGPSEGDLGYWVKFNYVKKSDYNWRAPFLDANYLRGYNTTLEDDMGSYVFGKKEIWYLASAETRTHKADFELTERKDGYGANNELQSYKDSEVSFRDNNAKSYALTKITLYTKANPGVPIKTVNFSYDYALCKNVPNNINYSKQSVQPESGKLTLQSVYFTYGNNKRGELNKYHFNYHENVVTNGKYLENPDYNPYKYDRWGNYKSLDESSSAGHNMRCPWVNQSASYDAQRHIDAAAWNLKEIKTPTGAKIEIKYESDDYGYVQNKQAMQMFKIASVGGTGGVTDVLSNNDKKVYFNLAKNIKSGTSDVDMQKEMDKYSDGSGKLYFKLYMKVRKEGDALEDYVSGYADIVGGKARVDLTSLNSGTLEYTRGYVELENFRIGSKTTDYHPFSAAAWQHIRTNQPQLMGIGKYDIDPNSSKGQKRALAKSLTSLLGDIRDMFGGFYSRADRNGWGKKVILDKSYIRLNNPCKKKYGGGVRVKEIAMRDDWKTSTGSTSEENAVYGQVYDYSMKEGGEDISSGVAAYEPIIGGEEIALRTARDFPEEIKLMTGNRLFSEFPVNESYYPAPIVGYRKVTVKSLATKYAGKKNAEDPSSYGIQPGIYTTGQSVYEFYTAKDYPVVESMTNVNPKEFNLSVPIPLIGNISTSKFTVSQGFSILLNDMHGKMKKVSQYEDKGNGVLNESPISYTEYFYFDDKHPNRTNDPDKVYWTLSNKVETLVSDKDGVVTKETRIVGQDYDFFTDMREHRTYTDVGGLNFNGDMVTVPFPIPAIVPWPSIGNSTTQLRTAVTNKVITRYGILKAVKTVSEGSLSEAENVLFDAQTGQPVLTKVKNEFEDPVYNYTIPAHMVYDGMGAAYKNIGLSFEENISPAESKYYQILASSSALPSDLVEGDEFMVSFADLSNVSKACKAIYVGKSSDGTYCRFYSETTINDDTRKEKFMLIRSGRRNHLTAEAGKIKALSDPTINRLSSTCSKTNEVPSVIKQDKLVIEECNNQTIEMINHYYSLNVFPNKQSLLTAPLNQYNICARNMRNYGPGYVLKEEYISYSSQELTITWVQDNTNTENPLDYVSYSTWIRIFTQSGANADYANIESLSDLAYESVGNCPGTLGDCYNIKIKYKGSSTLVNGYIRSSGLYKPIVVKEDVLVTNSEAFSFTNYYIDKVLNSSINTFTQNSLFNKDLLRGSYWTATNRNSFTTKDGYASGSQGVWRAYESYFYNKNRTQSSDVNLKQDGVYDQMSLFNRNPLVCDINWIKTNTICEYSPYNNETEGRDIAGNYSAALYGHKGDLATAVAKNARVSEIAFEGFEEFAPGTSVTEDNAGTGNFYAVTQAPTSGMRQTINLYCSSASNNLVIVDEPYNDNLVPTKVEVNGTVFSPLISTVTTVKGLYDVASYLPHPTDPKKFVVKLDPAKFPAGNFKWMGWGRFEIKMPTAIPATVSGSASIVSGTAHSGNNSLRVSGGAQFEQRGLKLQPRKKYYFSTWVNQNSDQPSFFASVTAKFLDINGNELSQSTTIVPKNHNINSWMKIEGEFEVPDNAVSLVLDLSTGGGRSGGYTAYFDDIRILPVNASMKSFVYNKDKLTLEAILDENNYATFYYYDAQGNLYLTKKETERGIQTLRESLSNIKKSNIE